MSMRGFSLLEMAIVLALLGLMFVLLATPIVRAIRTDSVLRAKSELDRISESLVGYAQIRKTLPESLALAGQTRDMFGNIISYSADSSLVSGDMCDGSLDVASVAQLQVNTSSGVVGNVAFFLGTAGPDKQQSILTDVSVSNTSIDVRDPGDDLALYLTWYELRAAVCTAYGGDQ